MARLAAALVLLALPARAEVDPPEPHDVVLLGAALAAIAADFSLSLDIRHHSVRVCAPGAFCVDAPTRAEGDPAIAALFGKQPTDWEFRAVALFDAAAVTAAWYWLPERWRWLPPVAALAVEGLTVEHNLRSGLTFRF